MLETSILQQVTEIFRNLEADYTFRISQSPLREESSQLIEFLNDFASTSPHLKVEIHEADGDTLAFCLGGMKQRYDTRRAEKKWPFIKPLVKYLSFADCGAIFDYVMLLLVFQWWYDGDHGYWVGYIYIFKYETNFCLMKTTYCLTS